jgi:hypothetical protein
MKKNIIFLFFIAMFISHTAIPSYNVGIELSYDGDFNPLKADIKTNLCLGYKTQYTNFSTSMEIDNKNLIAPLIYSIKVAPVYSNQDTLSQTYFNAVTAGLTEAALITSLHALKKITKSQNASHSSKQKFLDLYHQSKADTEKYKAEAIAAMKEC